MVITTTITSSFLLNKAQEFFSESPPVGDNHLANKLGNFFFPLKLQKGNRLSVHSSSGLFLLTDYRHQCMLI